MKHAPRGEGSVATLSDCYAAGKKEQHYCRKKDFLHGAKSASAAPGKLLSRCTSDRVFPDTTGPPDHVSRQNSRVLRSKHSSYRYDVVSRYQRGSWNPRPPDPLAFCLR